MDGFQERRIGELVARIDRHICVGFGDCLDAVPGAFALDADGIAVFTDGVEALDREALVEACRSCPVDAITLHDAEGRLLAP
jgi:ferredoxin